MFHPKLSLVFFLRAVQVAPCAVVMKSNAGLESSVSQHLDFRQSVSICATTRPLADSIVSCILVVVAFLVVS